MLWRKFTNQEDIMWNQSKETYHSELRIFVYGIPILSILKGFNIIIKLILNLYTNRSKGFSFKDGKYRIFRISLQNSLH